MTGLGTDVSWTRCLTKWKMFLVQARLQIDNQGSRFGWWMRLFLGNMNSVLLSARCGWWKSGLFLATGAAGGLLEVPSRSRLILLSANGSSTLFAGNWQVPYLQIAYSWWAVFSLRTSCLHLRTFGHWSAQLGGALLLFLLCYLDPRASGTRVLDWMGQGSHSPKSRYQFGYQHKARWAHPWTTNSRSQCAFSFFVQTWLLSGISFLCVSDVMQKVSA